MIDEPAQVINCLPFLVLFENEVALRVTLELPAEVQDIETTPVQIEQTRQVLVWGQLLFVELFTAMLVAHVAFPVN